jgi:hypothetical protein
MVRVVTTEGGQIRTSWTEVMTDLAQIEDQISGTASRWIEDISVGERVLAFVHSSNSELLSSLAAMARSGSEIAAVVFEGFMAGDNTGHAVNTLTSVGISAISCHLGEFSQAVKQMEQGATAVGTPAVVPVLVPVDPTQTEQVAA